MCLTKEQAVLLLEILELPQLTVPFPKATMAGELYAEIKRIVKDLSVDETSP